MKRNIAMYAVLIFAFCLGALLVSRIFGTSPSEATVRPAGECLVANRDLGPGHFLELSDLSWRPCSDDQARSGAAIVRRDSESLDGYFGAVLRAPAPADGLLEAQALVRTGDFDFLAAVLKPGSRAMAIRVDDVTGGAGLIRPGNLVDVIVSGKFGVDEGLSSSATAKTLLSAVRVLAVNRDVGVGEGAKPEENARSSRDAAKGTVTLEVSPKEVEVLTVAKTMGVLSLSLCSLAPEADGESMRAGETRASEIARRVAPTEEREARAIVTMFGPEQSRQARR
jgi:pilus assembly protein CpaB